MTPESANADSLEIVPPDAESQAIPLTRFEWSRTFLAASTFFLLLCSYYILRPVRDQMAVQVGTDRVPWLFTGTFICTLAVVPVFGWLVKHWPRTALVPLLYGTMMACLLGFLTAFSTGITDFSAALFFIWLSLFNLLVISLFWSCVSDAFTTSQAMRCYGYITAGGTAGAILGPAMTALLAERVSTSMLLLISVLLLAGAAVGLLALRQLSFGETHSLQRPIGGSIFAGVTETVTSPILRSLTVLVICYSAVSTVLYLELTRMTGLAYSDPGARTAFFARIDLSVNIAALTMQLMATRLIIQRGGLGWTLTLAPVAVLTGLIALGIWPSLLLLATVQVIHRAGEFSLSRPGREILFTTVDPESRYKAKNFIDTAVYRANDTVSAWIISTLLRVGVSTVWVIAIPVGLLWGYLGHQIGGHQDSLDR